MKSSIFKLLVGTIFLFLMRPLHSCSQTVLPVNNKWKTFDQIRPYLNAGYVTSLNPGCSDCDKNRGGSFRLGLLTRGRFGFNAGYAWYKTDLYDPVDYEDKGSAFLIGIDFLLMNVENVYWYIHGGVAYETFTSTYLYINQTDKENVFIPQLGCYFHIKHFNAYIGMATANFNIGIGYTF